LTVLDDFHGCRFRGSGFKVQGSGVRTFRVWIENHHNLGIANLGI
jgi:hypothetical protein